MAARRLIALLVVLLVISSIAAALAPTPAERDGESSTSTTTTETGAEGQADGAGTSSPELIEATAEVPPPRDEDGAPKRAPEPAEIDAAPGDQLALTVRTGETVAVGIPELGLLETASPGGPARFDVLLREPGTLAVLAEGGRQVATITVAEPRGPDKPKARAPARD